MQKIKLIYFSDHLLFTDFIAVEVPSTSIPPAVTDEDESHPAVEIPVIVRKEQTSSASNAPANVPESVDSGATVEKAEGAAPDELIDDEAGSVPPDGARPGPESPPAAAAVVAAGGINLEHIVIACIFVPYL